MALQLGGLVYYNATGVVSWTDDAPATQAECLASDLAVCHRGGCMVVHSTQVAKGLVVYAPSGSVVRVSAQIAGTGYVVMRPHAERVPVGLASLIVDTDQGSADVSAFNSGDGWTLSGGRTYEAWLDGNNATAYLSVVIDGPGVRT